MFPIEFRVKDFSPNENAFEFVRSILVDGMNCLGLTDADVLRVILSDSEQYGFTIREFAPEDGYTDDGIYQGVGKALPTFADGKYIGSVLILNICAISAFVPQKERALEEAEAMQYIVFHELGHCLDYRKRATASFTKHNSKNPSHVVRCVENHASQILAEYAACLFSARFLSSVGFRYTCETTSDNLGEYFKRVEEQVCLYRQRSVDLSAVRDAILLGFGRGQMEFAKLFAFIDGNPSLSPNNTQALLWPGISPHAARAMQNFGERLREAWKAYPNCENEFVAVCRETWFSITSEEGYRFEIIGEKDHLWLD